MNIQAYLNEPVSRKTALAVVLGQAVGNALGSFLVVRKLEQERQAIIDEANLRLSALREAVEFLVDRADSSTIIELDKKLDYWQIIHDSFGR